MNSEIIKIKKHFLLYKGYKLKCSIGKSGISILKKEGDFSTPRGTFKFGLLYYRKEVIEHPEQKPSEKIVVFDEMSKGSTTKWGFRGSYRSGFVALDEAHFFLIKM